MVYRIEHSRESGIVVWLEAPCGFKQPLMRWADLDGVKQFAGMLSDFYDRMVSGKGMNCEEKDNEMRAISDNLLRQALGDEA